MNLLPTSAAQLRSVLIVACVMAILFSGLRMGGDALAATKPQEDVLTYEVDPDSLREGDTVDMDRLTQVVDQRLNSAREQIAIVRKLDDRRIEIALLRKDEADRRRVERLLASKGTLEFRILADERDPKGDAKGIIERALAGLSKTKVADRRGHLLAWWVPVKPGEDRSLSGPSYAGTARRTREIGDRKITEILVLNDVYNVTGIYLKQARPSQDRRGRPCVRFDFNATGGKLFGEMTASHLPEKVTDFTYKLGVILDDELYSAPSIQSTIYDSGEITGSFTNQEVQDFARVLSARKHAGTNPAGEEERPAVNPRA